VERDNFEVGAPCYTTYKEVLNSDDVQFGGAGRLNSGKIKAIDKATDRMPYSISVNVPPLSTVVLEYDYTDAKPGDEQKAVKKAPAKKAPEKKATPVEKAPVEKTTVEKKTAERKTAEKKTVKETPAKKTASVKSTETKTVAKETTKTPVKKTTVSKKDK
jgi:1,4-alpha-glucan branching enzyme